MMTASPLVPEAQLSRQVLMQSQSARSSGPRRCGIVSAIKDEAAYIHEFIRHHLYFGFSEIVLLVNRTTDDNIRLLNKIAVRYPQVSYMVTDFIDDLGLSAAIQAVSLAYGIRALRKNRVCTHALVADADEFWTPVDFSSSIEMVLGGYKEFDLLSYNWAAQHLREQPFTPPLASSDSLACKAYKTVVRLDSPIVAVKAHHSILAKEYLSQMVWIDSFGVDKRYSVPLFGDESISPPSASPSPWWHRLLGQPVYVVHRVQRSEQEYLYNLLKGRAEENAVDAYRIKTYKGGFQERSNMTLGLDRALVEPYHKSLNEVVDQCDINREIDAARLRITATAAQFSDLLPHATQHIPVDERLAVLARVLSGTSFAVEA